MINISTVLKELDLPEKWKRIENPTFYNHEPVPFNVKKVESPTGMGYYQNGNMILKSPDNSIRWISMTIAHGEHVKSFDAKFDIDGKYIEFDINYFDGTTEENVYDEDYLNQAIKETVKYIQKYKHRFQIIS